MWHEGTIGIPKGDKYTIAHYWVKAFEEGSEYVILCQEKVQIKNDFFPSCQHT